MDNDKTIIMSPLQKAEPEKNPIDKYEDSCLDVSLIIGSDIKPLNNQLFVKSFTIGRAQDNDITIPDPEVSRYHVKVTKGDTNWGVQDLNSTNGSLNNGKQFNKEVLTLPCELQLGESNSRIVIKEYKKENVLESQLPLSLPDDITQIISDKSKTLGPLDELPSREEVFRRYISEDKEYNAGEYTQIVREVIKTEKNKKIKKYNFLIFGIATLLLASIVLVSYQHFKITKSKDIAISIFYNMKSLEIDLANAETQLKKNKDSSLLLSIDKKRETLKEMREHYADYVEELGILKTSKFSKNKVDRLIHKVARSFGEQDIDLPKDFIKETKKYIHYWQKSPRMRKAMQRLYKNNYDLIILKELKKEGLPLHFLYLAMQESNFNIRAVGKRTRWGIAKGPWQFIPSTARSYGLKIGPLEDSLIYDPEDERHDFEKSTKAAVKYLKYIYSTEAQASGLLVMASYNWGDHRVKNLISKMPNNPRDRNFWKLIQMYKIPEETYQYVFYIFSAAVISEDPKFFGFKYISPRSR